MIRENNSQPRTMLQPMPPLTPRGNGEEDSTIRTPEVLSPLVPGDVLYNGITNSTHDGSGISMLAGNETSTVTLMNNNNTVISDNSVEALLERESSMSLGEKDRYLIEFYQTVTQEK